MVVLRDITIQELRGILNYMYKGETLVKSHELPGLLKAAAQLKIRGMYKNEGLLQAVSLILFLYISLMCLSIKSFALL